MRRTLNMGGRRKVMELTGNDLWPLEVLIGMEVAG
jgi:hypothetical protein